MSKYRGWTITPVMKGYYEAEHPDEENCLWAKGLSEIKIEIDEYYEG